MTFPRWSWTLDGREIDLADWQCGADEAGYDSATGTVDEDTARRVLQESRLVGRVAGRVRWDGKIAAKPLVHRGQARLVAKGFREDAEAWHQRYLAQTRDFDLWTTVDSTPFNRSWATQAKFNLEIRPGSFRFLNETYAMATNDAHGFMFAARHVPGGITRIAYDWLTSALQFADFKIFGSTWLNVGIVQVGGSQNLGGAASGSYDSGVFAGKDQLELQCIYNNSTTLTGPWQAIVRNVRVNGRATGDVMYGHQIVADLAALLGFEADVVPTTFNSLPFDVVGESALAALERVARLEDRPLPFIGGDGETVIVEYRPRDATVWTVHLAGDAEPDLERQPDINQVAVKFPVVAGYDEEIIRTVEEAGLPNSIKSSARPTLEVTIDDVQTDTAFPIQVADAHLVRASQPSLEGRLQIAAARGPGVGVTDPYAPTPGESMKIADYGPAEDVVLPITSAEWTQDSVHLGVNAEATFGLVDRAALETLRAPSTEGLEEETVEPPPAPVF